MKVTRDRRRRRRSATYETLFDAFFTIKPDNTVIVAVKSCPTSSIDAVPTARRFRSLLSDAASHPFHVQYL